MPEYPLRPLSYRAELLNHVMPALKAGECCSLIGVSGAGKSNLVRFLARTDVQVAYWNTDTILRELYGEQEYEANDERLDNLLRRLRDALGEDVRNPRYLITHRGAGVQLTRVQE